MMTIVKFLLGAAIVGAVSYGLMDGATAAILFGFWLIWTMGWRLVRLMIGVLLILRALAG